MIPVLITLPFAVFGMVFQLSFITVGKAGFGAALSVMGGVLYWTGCLSRFFTGDWQAVL